MTNQATLTLTNLKHERKQQLARQLSINADTRRRWAAADHLEARQARMANDDAILSDYYSRDRLPFKVLKAAAEISSPAIPWITSLLFAWRGKRAQPLIKASAITSNLRAPIFSKHVPFWTETTT